MRTHLIPFNHKDQNSPYGVSASWIWAYDPTRIRAGESKNRGGSGRPGEAVEALEATMRNTVQRTHQAAALSLAIALSGWTVAAQGQAQGRGQGAGAPAPAPAPAAPAPGQGAAGQGGGRGRGQAAPQTAQAAAPIDLTGWWVSIVTEDWRWRMVTPAKLDYASVPISNEGRRVADTWDPAKTSARGTRARPTARPRLCACPAACTSRGRMRTR